VQRIVGSFPCYKGLGKTVRYNDTRDANERTTYYIIHKLFPIKALRLMSASNENLLYSLLW